MVDCCKDLILRHARSDSNGNVAVFEVASLFLFTALYTSRFPTPSCIDAFVDVIEAGSREWLSFLPSSAFLGAVDYIEGTVIA